MNTHQRGNEPAVSGRSMDDRAAQDPVLSRETLSGMAAPYEGLIHAVREQAGGAHEDLRG
jgi:hypothetical protein